MRKVLLAGMIVAMMATPAFAQTYKFVIVPKAMNNPFFDFARDGCQKRAKELGNIECIYKGPVEHEPATQAQIIQDFVTQKVDGLAISVADVAAMTTTICMTRECMAAPFASSTDRVHRCSANASSANRIGLLRRVGHTLIA